MRAGAALTARSGAPRWAVVDVVRGVAILAVVAFHTTWDLGDLRLISWRISAHESGTVIAHAIAGSFLVLVGASLVLAHGRGIRWTSFWRREVKLVVLALLVTLASWVYQPGEVITFGILHSIAVASVLVLPAVRGPRLLPWVLAVVALVLPWLVQLPGRSASVSWTGLADGTRPALDWQPVLPWLALAFVGVGLMHWLAASPTAAVARLRSWSPSRAPVRWVGVFGRHTLAIYLLHQPIVYGVIWLLAPS